MAGDDPTTILAAADGASVSYGGRVDALRDVSCAIVRGERVAVVGPSGCGKSTLVRLLAGLIAPTSGRVRPATGAVGIAFQQPTLLPWRRVVDNVALPLELAGRAEGEATAQALATLARVGLGDVAHAYPVELSGGMRMRAALARALVVAPAILLLDEPFSSLDELLRETLAEDLAALAGAAGVAFLLVTHSVREAVFLADRVLVMAAQPGRVVADVPIGLGPVRTAALRDEPAFHRRVAEVTAALRRSA